MAKTYKGWAVMRKGKEGTNLEMYLPTRAQARAIAADMNSLDKNPARYFVRPGKVVV